ncbi:MAG TPA: M10 family metallopeptidase C-terminal domain-containing protein [Allosphingosinicella sp.]
MCTYCAMKGLRSRNSTEETIAHVGAKGSLASVAAASAGELTSSDLQSLQMSVAKLSEGFAIDGVGDLKPPVSLPALLITTDNVPDAPDTAGSTNPMITVTGPGVTTPIVSTIDTIGDQDFYKVTLAAGTTYEFGMYSYNGGPNAAGVTDPYMELYAADGSTLVVSADGGANTPYNEANSGFDVLLTYTPTASGTYYVNARAFSNTPVTPTGDSVGDYQLFVRQQDPNDPTVYKPYYAPTEPLYALDWGSQVNRVNQSARNPDGNEGTRSTSANGADPTGNAQGTPVYSTLLDIPALAASQGKDVTGKNVITIYFAKQGDLITSLEDPTSPGLPPATLALRDVQDFEFDAVMTALAEFEKVADVVYLVVDDRAHADFTYASYQGTPGPGVSLLGSMSPPDEPDEGLAQFNSGDERWNAVNLAQGGFSFVTLIHEFGHGHGMAHPHDNGGKSGIMNGVVGEGAGVADYTTGDYDLNQGVFTMMSYEDGWQTSPYGNAETDVGYGYLGGLMAFDIAVIQDKYGVNEEHATGNDVYTLKDVNAAGTFYSSIWDGGGTDSIVYDGSKDANIDLRQATLRYEVGGGGYVSYATGIFGGFTIANGVTIENASGGSGNDKLTGNAADNRLEGNGGNDTFYLWSGGGNDTAMGGAGSDIFFFGGTLDSADVVRGGSDSDTLVVQGAYGALALTPNVTEIEAISLLAGSNTTFGEPGTNRFDYVITTHDSNFAPGLQARINGSALLAGEDFTFDGSAETDASFVVYGGKGKDTLTGGLGNDIFFFAEERFASGDTVNGGAGYDGMFLRGNYTIDFNAPGYAGLFTNIENLTLTSTTDERYARGGGTEFDYNITLSDAIVGAGQQMTVSGALLMATETMIVDASQESDGSLRLFGGAAGDTLKGGAMNDLLHGNLGADSLSGGGGSDTFAYNKSSESTSGSRDHILDFAAGSDRIDLSKIDADTSAAGNQAFSFIGSNAFSGTAGQLRAFENGGSWFVEGDTNGDSVADLVIQLTVTGGPLTQTDFLP